MSNSSQAKLELRPLTPEQLEKARQTLCAGRYAACRKAPYMQHIIHRFVVREHPPTPEFHTVACTADLIFLACMEYVATLTPEMMMGDFLHEALHVLNRHHKRRGHREPARWNIAADLAIDPIVRDMGVQQTPVASWPADYGFEENLAAEAYYNLLEKQAKNGAGGKGDGTPRPGSGHCGSCAGNAVPGEPPGGDPEGRSEAEIQGAIRATAQAIKAYAASKDRGTLPAGLQILADEALAPPRVPWQQQLQRSVRGACAWAAGAVDYRYDAPGRRQASLGYGAGRPVLPRLRQPRPRVAFGLDTSGSMGCGKDSPLALGISEALGVVKAVGAEVDYLSCDAAVHAVRKVHSATDILAATKGGGGTSFVPVFEAVAKLRPRPQLLIFATDGYDGGELATRMPAPLPGIRTIFLVIGGGPVPAPWGEVIRIEEG